MDRAAGRSTVGITCSTRVARVSTRQRPPNLRCGPTRHAFPQETGQPADCQHGRKGSACSGHGLTVETLLACQEDPGGMEERRVDRERTAMVSDGLPDRSRGANSLWRDYGSTGLRNARVDDSPSCADPSRFKGRHSAPEGTGPSAPLASQAIALHGPQRPNARCAHASARSETPDASPAARRKALRPPSVERMPGYEFGFPE